MSERYSLSRAMSKLDRPIDQIKNVMRYSDVSSVSIGKFTRHDKDGNEVTKFYTNIHSNINDGDDDYIDEEE